MNRVDRIKSNSPARRWQEGRPSFQPALRYPRGPRDGQGDRAQLQSGPCPRQTALSCTMSSPTRSTSMLSLSAPGTLVWPTCLRIRFIWLEVGEQRSETAIPLVCSSDCRTLDSLLIENPQFTSGSTNVTKVTTHLCTPFSTTLNSPSLIASSSP
jgi:hypothetical protein